jgi:hypothetical protein
VDRYVYGEKIDEKTHEPVIVAKQIRADEEVEKEVDEKVNTAISQIKDKKYYEPYLLQKKEIILVGLAVSSKAKHVKARFERL